MIESQQKIAEKCDELREFLLSKNRAYGDSVLNPARIVSRAPADEQILVRIDDKLNRLRQGEALPTESLNDTVRDLAGYFVLLMVARGIDCDLEPVPIAPAAKPEKRFLLIEAENAGDNVIVRARCAVCGDDHTFLFPWGEWEAAKRNSNIDRKDGWQSITAFTVGYEGRKPVPLRVEAGK